jgi:transposase-like protein
MGNFKVISKEVKEQVISRIKNDGISVATAASDAGVSTKSVYNWLSSEVYANPSLLEINKLKRENQFLLELVGKLTMEQEKQKSKGKKS